MYTISNKNISPEGQWDVIKKIIFKEKTPKKINDLIMRGFNESTSENEKWEKLKILVELINKKYNNAVYLKYKNE